MTGRNQGGIRNNNIRIPPQSIPSERAVLGSIMLRKEAMHEVEDIITPESFYVEKHKMIFRAMLDLSVKNEPIDMLSLSTKLSEKKLLEAVGGNKYLAEIVNEVPSSVNVKHYAEIVQKKYVLRSLIEAADYVSELAFEESDDHMDDILDMAEKKVFSVVSSPKNQKYVNLKDALPEAYERLEKLHENRGMLRGLATGFKDLDNMLSGFQKSDLVILAARPSMGKTTLALDIARMSAVANEKSVLVFSLEMSSQQLVDRMLSAQSRVNAWNLRTGRLSSDREFSLLRDSLDKLAKAKIFIDDQPGNSIVRMKSLARRLKAEKGLDLIVVDYLQLMTTSKNYDSMVNQVTEISRSLKALAKELDVPVLALSQLSRAVEARGGKPRLSDLRDSGSIEQDADVVMFIHMEDKGKEESEKTNIAEILIEKHRNGPTGKIELYFDQKTTTFLSLEKSSLSEFTTPKVGGELDEF
ncbi:replicative DNA helicase [Candidatus Nomurabacteria bacterium RIFCSPHIGHO2_02_FULL_41_18]|uniref:Replicative DNA helicase n=1 Tax=Candidatus Nomurabacteria bacterium RIFCSPHIGHO2_02_FULL_41_18 TaxID=1801754 RepID=A0A1F6W5J8_9BACT|nr:MAG: replicative DNA helicase [Candidatus Nomurabacteria bacterium RIFCSPHIGHO2_01_FULL_41_71]OGI77036.1 MAG: replicative DNA helicase [Candidatus Nomurabacteria bacterium RIFCSPHIGHO2_02_FULL_41_18]OGI90159.1 MAG: replicative DNA helicase [Candidatus Nomurabacteria bacterium RIFCSPLOWO2_01_FULL_41_52b]OGJ00525.1 MAG: replicative DNA helicase [Candidatus Nomurabacteria bacterium RIFCSPLOWO2_02_FULL_41_9]